MPKSLKDFFLRFVSVVDKGDNPEADIVMFKSEKGKEENKDGDLDDLDKKKCKKEGGGVMKTLEEILKSLSEDDVKVINDEIEKAKTDAKADADAEIAKAKTEFEAELDKVKKEEDKDKKPQGTASFDDVENVIKSADPKVVELIEKMKSEKSEIEKKAQADAEELSKMKEAARTETIIKTVSQFDRVNAPQDDLVSIWKSVDSETEAKLVNIFKAVNEQLTQANIIKVIGSDADASAISAEEEMEKMAQEIKKNEGITIEQARTKVYKTRPDLLKKYREEKGV